MQDEGAKNAGEYSKNERAQRGEASKINVRRGEKKKLKIIKTPKIT
jgi:hypothetical protein